ncbi:DUF6756 family protein [Deinococcus alpinitundrae]|uniref:DUF6756 family protein n=1 Tax=Deinococcus alpinitundrae TaxID=468913 RepID=UPI00192A634E|nr:DUF6756 family protein [Deinococcus alpinitundrae]
MRTEISAALKALHLPAEDMVAVRSNRYRTILSRILEAFTSYGAQGRDRLWLWEGFKGEQYTLHLKEPKGYRLLWLVPPDEQVYLLTEDWGRQKHDGNYWVFEGRAGAIEAVLRELFAFEYYIRPPAKVRRYTA